MATPGPKPSCACGACPRCRGRAAARRAYHRSMGRPVPLLRQPFRPSRLVLPAAATDLAYIAGIVDGEGCVTKNNGGWKVQVAMTDRPVIEWLGMIGGTVRERSVTGNRQPCWRWLVMRQREVLDLLGALRPYMRVKNARADEAMGEIRARLDELLALERVA